MPTIRGDATLRDDTMEQLDRLYRLSKSREYDDPMRGELGVIHHPYGTSTEKSITVGAPTKYFNIPLMVQGLGREDIRKIVMEQASGDEMNKYVENALNRFRERGGSPEYYATIEQAIEAARNRSMSKNDNLENTVPYNAGVLDYRFR